MQPTILKITKDGPTGTVTAGDNFDFTLTPEVLQGDPTTLTLVDYIDALSGVTFKSVTPREWSHHARHFMWLYVSLNRTHLVGSTDRAEPPNIADRLQHAAPATWPASCTPNN